MFENSLSANSITRMPRGVLLLNGNSVPFINLQVSSNTYFLADTFSVEIPMSGQSFATPQYLSSESAIMAEIFIGFPADPNSYNQNELDSLILGEVNEIENDFINRKIILTGRDLTAKFIDNKTTQKYPNLTASQIVELLAKKEGLTAEVTPTTLPAGVFYANNHTTLTSEQPEWDLITYLAQQENFVAYVTGTTLHFHPAPKETDTPYLLQYVEAGVNSEYSQGNFSDLKTIRSLTLARDVIVTVRSWNSSAKKAFKVSIRATPNKKTALASQAQPIGDAQVFSYVIPGLTREQALQKAQQIVRQITQHERKIQVTLPADNELKKVGVIKLQGTNTDYDQIYFTSSVNRVLSEEGYKMIVTAKNHSPNSEVSF